MEVPQPAALLILLPISPQVVAKLKSRAIVPQAVAQLRLGQGLSGRAHCPRTAWTIVLEPPAADCLPGRPAGPRLLQVKRRPDAHVLPRLGNCPDSGKTPARAVKPDIADGVGNIPDGVWTVANSPDAVEQISLTAKCADGVCAIPVSPDGVWHFSPPPGKAEQIALASNLADGVCPISQPTSQSRVSRAHATARSGMLAP